MKIVRFVKPPVEILGKQFANRGFPGCRYTENNHDHSGLVCRRVPIFSIRKATTTTSV
jgi:hypothetical protein